MALALVLLVSAGLMIRSFQALRSVDPGFTEPEHVQTFTSRFRRAMVAEPERVTRMQHEVLDKIAAIPGVAVGGVHDAGADGQRSEQHGAHCRRRRGRWPDAAEPAGQGRFAGHVPHAGNLAGGGTRFHLDRSL